MSPAQAGVSRRENVGQVVVASVAVPFLSMWLLFVVVAAVLVPVEVPERLLQHFAPRQLSPGSATRKCRMEKRRVRFLSETQTLAPS